MKRISALLGGAVFSIAILAACGGGGSGTSSPGGPIPAGPTDGPTTSPSNFTSTDAVPVPNPGATSAPVTLAADSSGAAANAAIPPGSNVPADTTVASTFSSAGDASLPALAIKRATQSVRGLREDNHKTVVAYLRLQFSADVSLPQAPAFTFVVPGTLPTTGITYWLAFIDPLRAAAGWQLGFEGPAVVTAATTAGGKSGTQLAFASNGKPLSFVAGQVYYFAVYAVGATVATPTPVPSSVPTNPPTEGKPAPVLATPQNIQFTSVTASTPVPVTFVQQGFSGPFTLHGDCTGIINTSGGSPTWTITPVGQGRCVIVGLGDKGASAIVHVGVITPFETPRPTSAPTTAPSHSPEPTHAPTTAPTNEPSESPEPTHPPTTAPTTSPSRSPEPTHPPTTAPTTSPSHSPEPTHPPTTAPTTAPSHSPEPTQAPTTGPTSGPNASPSPSPTPTPGSSPANVKRSH